MRNQIVIPSFYYTNYHSLIMVACLIIGGFRLLVTDHYFESAPFIDQFIFYSLTLMGTANAFGLVKSFLTKNYSSIHQTNSDLFQLVSFILLIAFKFCIMFLSFLLWSSEQKNGTINVTLEIIIGIFFVVYYLLYSVFFYFGLNGVITRFKKSKITYHWVFDYLNDSQIKSVKSYQEEGKTSGIYFRGFLLNEGRNVVYIDDILINLNEFRLYMKSKNCKISELSNDDIKIMEMLSI
jgi:hypothetical protein